MSHIEFKVDSNPSSIVDFPVRVGDLWVVNQHFPIFRPIITQYVVVRIYDDLLYGYTVVLEDKYGVQISTFDPREVSVCQKTMRFDPYLRIWYIDYLD